MRSRNGACSAIPTASTNGIANNGTIAIGHPPIIQMAAMKKMTKGKSITAVIVANPALPVKTFSELIDYARTQPGKLNFASPGVGTPNHLGIEMLNQMAGITVRHVPYKGDAPALTDVAAGQIEMMFASVPLAVAYAKARLQMRALSGPKAPDKAADSISMG